MIGLRMTEEEYAALMAKRNAAAKRGFDPSAGGGDSSPERGSDP